MILFKQISYKNFLSTGSQPNIIQLNSHGSTLITGKNGEGKSTILDALTFALFGKPFRNVNKNQLINSINQKQCLVEIEFSINGVDYKVRRGMKPTIFEIISNGELINQDAALRDYQKVLEQQILKLNFKSFTQVVILGSATFVPFMQLPAAQRRDVIEDLLDIRVFSVMNGILKERAAELKSDISKIESSLKAQKALVESQKNLISVMETNRRSLIASINKKIQLTDEQIQIANAQSNDLKQQIDSAASSTDDTEVLAAINKVEKIRYKTISKIESCTHTHDFFVTNTQCPTCEQSIQEEHKERMLLDITESISDHTRKLGEFETMLEKLNKKLVKIQSQASVIRKLSLELSTQTTKIQMLQEAKGELQKEIQGILAEGGDISLEKEKLKSAIQDSMTLLQTKNELLETRRLQDIAATLLKDTGIKTAIIREYLPAMNKLINRYLSSMDFFVKFELDESFNEVIRSRARDEFSYESFSEGEKRRIDLSILFTWRQIAKMKNSVNTNLMILDEILDGSLDSVGIDYFLSIMNQFGEHTNVFVISHRDVADKFDNVIRVQKRGDFSVLV